MRRNWQDRTRPLWRIGNRLESLQLRRLGFSPMSVLNPGSVMVLETTGRRTLRRRFTPLGYWEDGGAFLIGGGAGGMTTVPDWVRNLRAEPRAAVWIRRSRTAVVARELLGDERDRAQEEAAKIWSGVPKYAARAQRVIPYFELVPAPDEC